ncbi:hypothetical protein AB0F11_22705 [Streptomyces sp. NPDC032472]|uniref:hypothetical protein n=1 Tax=Streptomyces sp. NPDC032472 TaxID=3155018 RepID=UPI0033D22088
MSTLSRRTLVRAAAVTACAGGLLALPAAAALADGVPAASAAHSVPRTLVKTLALADGVSRANVYRAGSGFQADILGADGSRAATLTSRDGVAGVGGSGELHAALQPDGRLSSWVGDAAVHSGTPGGDGYKTGTRDGKADSAAGAAAAVSRTQVRAAAAGTAGALHLEALADGPGEGVLLLAAGGGMAAVGAAGLSFAMLRRGRTEG